MVNIEENLMSFPEMNTNPNNEDEFTKLRRIQMLVDL